MCATNNNAGMPIAITLEAGTHYRCTCGKSTNLPFCDGSHRAGKHLPLRFTLEKTQKVYLCSGNRSVTAAVASNCRRAEPALQKIPPVWHIYCS